MAQGTLYLIKDATLAVSGKPYTSGGENRPPRLLSNKLLIDQESGKIGGVPTNVVGFALEIFAPSGAILCQRDYGKDEYFGLMKSSEASSDPMMEWRQARSPIEVRNHKGWGLYTVWPDKRESITLRCNNNVGLWEVEEDGHIRFRRIGIVSPNGVNFCIVHDVAWDGKLFNYRQSIVGVPSDLKYGPFSARASILDYEPFTEALPSILPEYEGTEEELEIRLALPTEPNTVIIDWWNPFMGMGRGQGIVLGHDGTIAWLRGQDVEGLDPNKSVHLERGQPLELIPQPNGKVVVNDMGKTPRVVGARLIP